MPKKPHDTESAEALDPLPDPETPCDLDDLVPPTRRSDWINWTIGFFEISGIVIFLSVFIFLIVRYFFGIER